jgi:hypothetical protein
VQVETLIDRFRLASTAGYQLAGDFPPTGSVPTAEGAPEGSAAATFAGAFRSVVACGLSALPVLIDHLGDARPTNVVVDSATAGSICYSNEFDARPYDRNPHPPGTTDEGKGPDLGGVSRYTVTVGDICYSTIGLIVGRTYAPLSEQPTATLVINSTVHSSAPAAAVRAEWGGVTPSEYERCLVENAYANSAAGGDDDALTPLCYFYPDVGGRLVIALLKRPICDYGIASDFVYSRLLEVPQFDQGEITDVSGVVAELAAPSDVVTYLKRRLPNWDHSWDGVPDSSPSASLSHAAGAADGMNYLMSLPDLYSPAAFASIALRPETRRLLSMHPTGLDLLYANRLLLEDVFAGRVARRPPPSRDPSVWRRRMIEFVTANGPAYRDYLWYMLVHADGRYAYSRDIAANRVRSIVVALYPDRSEARPVFVNACDIDQQEGLLAVLSPFHNPDVETAVDRLLQEITRRLRDSRQAAAGSIGNDEYGLKACGRDCVAYLHGHGYVKDCNAFDEASMGPGGHD